MARLQLSAVFSCFLVISLTAHAQSLTKVQIPTCPAHTTRQFYPDAPGATWTGCKDDGGLFQGILIQFSSSKEIIRIAGVKDSEREGREVRVGNVGFLEERNFVGGHLEGASYIYKSDSTIGKILPKVLSQKNWQDFVTPPGESLMRPWINQAPYSTLHFSNGRIVRIQYETKDYHFHITKDKRMMAENVPDMKDLFFIDPEPLWYLNPSDLKAALLPGFGSCKKYSGPIGRFGRHFDTLIFKQESNQKKHETKLKEMRTRFIKFCLPENMLDHLGRMECPPQLPTTFSPQNCIIPVSDQLHLPYDEKFFKFEYSLGRSPEDIHAFLIKQGFLKFVSKFEAVEDIFTFTKDFQISVKKTGDGVLFHPLEKDKQGRIKVRKNNSDGSKDWWEWHRLPGF